MKRCIYPAKQEKEPWIYTNLESEAVTEYSLCFKCDQCKLLKASIYPTPKFEKGM